ncbi:MAG: peroxiredoxin family protein [Bdellovibrionales bacterium]
MRIFILSFLAFIVVAGPVKAEVEIGQPFPVALSLEDSNGDVQTLESIRGEKGTVLVFVRSVDWCPYCQVQLLDLKADGKEIDELGYNIVPVSYDSTEALNKFKTKYKFPYTLLSDEGSSIIKELGILNENYDSDHFAYGVPHPTIFLLRYDGTVFDILYEEGHRKRPHVERVLGSVKVLGR